jgi:hypothetical protein
VPPFIVEKGGEVRSHGGDRSVSGVRQGSASSEEGTREWGR